MKISGLKRSMPCANLHTMTQDQLAFEDLACESLIDSFEAHFDLKKRRLNHGPATAALEDALAQEEWTDLFVSDTVWFGKSKMDTPPLFPTESLLPTACKPVKHHALLPLTGMTTSA